ncbi:MAG TPA: hypothetical protein PKD08_03700, partial [Gudongella oleilytica]|nr:hypothetical protein [Gudongella oleilytica]
DNGQLTIDNKKSKAKTRNGDPSTLVGMTGVRLVGMTGVRLVEMTDHEHRLCNIVIYLSSLSVLGENLFVNFVT